MANILDEMLKLLSGEDKVIFQQLSDKLKTIGGDLSQLSPQEHQLILQMEKKYSSQIQETQKTHEAQQAEQEAVTDIELLDLPFAGWVRQMLARDLGERFPEEGEAVKFVFENKWLPIDCQEERLVTSVFERYEADIVLVNQWREEMLEVNKDKKMAVGLAWFMMIFQMNQRLNG